MKLKRIGSGSVTKEIYDNGTVLYVSYATPVGVVPSYGEWKGKLILTDKRYSVTTSKQVSTKIVPDYNENYGEEILTMPHITFLSIIEVLSNKGEVKGAGRGWNDRVSTNIKEYDSWGNVEPVKRELFNDVERRFKRKNPDNKLRIGQFFYERNTPEDYYIIPLDFPYYKIKEIDGNKEYLAKKSHRMNNGIFVITEIISGE